MTLARLTRLRAICPYCGVRFSRWGVLRGGRRRCGACTGVVVPTEPANFLGSLSIGILTAFLIIVTFTTGALIGDSMALELWSLLIALPFAAVGAITGLGIGWLVWPYFTPFHAHPGTCLRCRYDLRATRWKCPECGLVQASFRLATVPVAKEPGGL